MIVAIYVSTIFSFLILLQFCQLELAFLIALVFLQQFLFSVSQSYHPLMSELWEQVFLSQMKEISGTTFVFHSLSFAAKQTEVLSEVLSNMWLT